MRFLFLFLDGVGLGDDNPDINPFARVPMPHLENLLGGTRLVRSAAPRQQERVTLLALDACLGVPGLPQSATGQATLVTGRNIPAEIGYHYGPKPNSQVAESLRNGTLFKDLTRRDRCAVLLNAYPPRYFEAIDSGRRIYSAIPMAVTEAGIPLRDSRDLYSGNALAADFTARGWREFLGFADAPLITPFEAGERMANLAKECDLSFFEYWLSDYAGHHQSMEEAVRLLGELDQVLAGLANAWDDGAGLALVTSDHGNLEDLSTRRHTSNPVPALLLGSASLRAKFCESLDSLADVTPAILRFLG